MMRRAQHRCDLRESFEPDMSSRQRKAYERALRALALASRPEGRAVRWSEFAGASRRDRDNISSYVEELRGAAIRLSGSLERNVRIADDHDHPAAKLAGWIESDLRRYLDRIDSMSRRDAIGMFTEHNPWERAGDLVDYFLDTLK